MFNKISIFDGAIGTELYSRGFFINRPFEELNLNSPVEVENLHRAYLDSGAQFIRTNTFSISKYQLKKFDIENKQNEFLAAALEIVNKARQKFLADHPGSSAKIGLAMGPVGLLVEPLGPLSLEDVRSEFRHLATEALKKRECFDFFHLETFSNLKELRAAVRGIRDVSADIPLLASMSIKADQSKVFVPEFAREFGDLSDVQALGINCSEGPSELFTQLKLLKSLTEKPIIVQPNAGIPRHLNGRYFYMTSPDYLAKYAKRYIEAGAKGVGGCCGTGPDHIRAIGSALKMLSSQDLAKETVLPKIEILKKQQELREHPVWSERKKSRLGSLLKTKKHVISIEVTSPRGIDTRDFFERLEGLASAGIDFVNVPDGPRASTRISSLHLSAAILARMGNKIGVIPHYTTRDRNLIALQSDLLGAYINGVSDILIVTGDPPKVGNNRDATGVYDIDSIGLTFLASCLNRGLSPGGDELGSATEFGIGVAANPTAINLELEIERWKYKVEMGADYAITQPIYDPELYFRWRDKADRFGERPHLVGVWPFISLRNAEFMANEVPGVSVPGWAIEEMAKAGDDKNEAKKRGVEIAQKVILKLSDACSGFCISAPLGKTEVALETAKVVR